MPTSPFCSWGVGFRLRLRHEAAHWACHAGELDRALPAAPTTTTTPPTGGHITHAPPMRADCTAGREVPVRRLLCCVLRASWGFLKSRRSAAAAQCGGALVQVAASPPRKGAL
jgi:hypothetical protein